MKLDGHTLYHFAGCTYCARVNRAIEDLGLELQRRDIHQDAAAREELVTAQGRATVPVLRIEDGDETRWLPESADIVRDLYARFGDGRRPPLRTWIGPREILLAIAAVGLLIAALR